MADTFQADNSFQYLGDAPPQQPLLFYQIGGRPAFSYGDIMVQPNAKVLADGTSMLWMDSSLQVETECYGGCAASCMRTCSGESCCMNNYSGAGKLTVGFETPGDMLAFATTPSHGWALTAMAFVAGTANLKVSSRFVGCVACFCSEENLFITTVEVDEDSGTDAGVFLAGSYGMLERHDIPSGKTMYVGNGNFFACQKDRSLEMYCCVGGLLNCWCGMGQKSIVFKFDGPCTIYTQSRNPMDLKRLQEAAKRKKQEEQGGNNGQGSAE